MHGSGAVSCSCSLLIRGPIVPAVRQKLHLSPCADSRSRLCIHLEQDINPNVSPTNQSSEKVSRFTTTSLLKLWSIDKAKSNCVDLCGVVWIARQLTKGDLGAKPITIKHFQYR